ncbi:hypothetical protein YC2023_053672 [Brassica napus]
MEIDKAIGESDDKRLKTKYNNAPDEEFEEYLRHLISEQCTCDRNEISSIKCPNVIVLAATNTEELDKEWECLTELTELGGSTSPN